MELCCHLYPFSKHIPICMYLPYMHYYMYIYQFNLFTNVEQLSSPPNYRGYFIFLSKCKLIFITCLLCNYLCFWVYHCGFIVGNVTCYRFSNVRHSIILCLYIYSILNELYCLICDTAFTCFINFRIASFKFIPQNTTMYTQRMVTFTWNR